MNWLGPAAKLYRCDEVHMGWSIDGKRVELRAGFPAGKLVVLDGKEVLEEHKLSATGEWPFTINHRPYTFLRLRGFAAPKDTVSGLNNVPIPPTPLHVAALAAPAGSLCAQHQQPASLSCARCGAFACGACAGSDLTHCEACMKGLTATAQKDAAAMMYMAPAAIFVVTGGFIGGLLGGAAGAAAVAYARRTESRGKKIAVAAGLYVVAGVLMLVIATVIAAARQK